jgi:hypothetical protein
LQALPISELKPVVLNNFFNVKDKTRFSCFVVLILFLTNIAYLNHKCDAVSFQKNAT